MPATLKEKTTADSRLYSYASLTRGRATYLRGSRDREVAAEETQHNKALVLVAETKPPTPFKHNSPTLIKDEFLISEARQGAKENLDSSNTYCRLA